MAAVIFLALTRIGYSDGDDAFFYQHSTSMKFSEFLSWRYGTWSGRLSSEALAYVVFNLGLGFWRVANALMLVLLPAGILRLGKAAVFENREFGQQNIWAAVRYPLLLASGYLLMSVMTLGYSAIWVSGSIFYTWSFTAGVWAMVPFADAVFGSGEFRRRQFLYAIPCGILAAMAMEQMGAVLIAFEALSILSLRLQKRKIPVMIWIQLALTFASFSLLLFAPGNALRVEAETVRWLPEFQNLALGNRLFMTAQWILSSFANESKAFFIAIWVAGILLLKKENGKFYAVLVALFVLVAILPYAGIHAFSEMGIGYIDIEQCLTELPTWEKMTVQNRVAFFWWMAAVIFTQALIWKVSNRSRWISLVFWGGIASEAMLFFSPTIYASGARVYYLTDLLYLFLILWLSMRMENERKKNLYIAGTVAFGAFHFLSQYSVVLSKLG